MRRKSRPLGCELMHTRLSRFEPLERRLLLTSYYINDGSSVSDMWCTAIGNDANSGLTPALPKLTVQNLMTKVTLAPGDNVYIDTGTYLLSAEVKVTLSGTDVLPISFIASPYGVTYNRQNSGTYAWNIFGASYVNLRTAIDTTPKYPAVGQQWMKITGATSAGIYMTGANDQLSQIDVTANAGYGIQLQSANNTTIQNCVVRGTTGTGGTGISVYGGAASIINCTIYGNGTTSGRGVFGTTGSTLTLKNNIIVATTASTSCYGVFQAAGTLAASDYNDIYAVTGARVGNYLGTACDTLTAWQAATPTLDAHSQSVDPQFVDSVNGNLNIQSNGGRYNQATASWVNDLFTSLCIDAGDPASSSTNEPSPNGSRINQGSFGGTVFASKQDLVPPGVLSWVLTPDTGYSNTDKVTTSLKPSMAFSMSEIVVGEGIMVTLRDPTMTVIPATSYTVTGWNSTVVTVAMNDNAPLTMPGQYTLTFGIGIHDTSVHTNYPVAPIDLNFTVDLTPPTVVINQAASQADPSKNSPIHFTALFSEKVYGFTTGSVVLGGTAGATTVVITNPSGDMTTYDLAVSGMVRTGTVTASLTAGAATDMVGNPTIVASTSTDNTVTYDITAPTANFAAVSTPRGATLDQIGLTFSEPAATLNYSNLRLARDGVSITLTSSVTAISSDLVNWSIGNLGSFTSYDGSYTLSTVGLTDVAGNAVTTSPSVTWFMASGKISTVVGNNTIRLVVNASDHTKTDVFVNAPGSTPTYSASTTTFVQFQISCGVGNDQLTVDFTNGNPLPSAGVIFSGGTYTTGNTVTITGSSGNEILTVSPTIVSVSGAPIAYSGITSFFFDLGTGSDELILDGGTLNLAQNGALTSGTAVTVNSGTLNLGGKTDTIDSLMLRGGSVTNGTLTVNSFCTVSTGTISANLAGGAALFKATTGTVVLSGTNTYTGGTFISGGVLQTASGSANILPDSGNVQLYGTGVLDLQGRSDTVGTVLVLGGSIINGTLLGAVTEIQSVAPSFSLYGPGNLLKTGPATVTLSLANHYGGSTTVTGGTIVVANPDALPAGTHLNLSGGSVVLQSDLGQAIELGGLSFLSGAASSAGSSLSDSATPVAVSTASIAPASASLSVVPTSAPTSAVADSVSAVGAAAVISAQPQAVAKQTVSQHAFIGPILPAGKTIGAPTKVLAVSAAVQDAALVAPVQIPASSQVDSLVHLVYAPGKVGPFKKQSLSLHSLDQLFAEYAQTVMK